MEGTKSNDVHNVDNSVKLELITEDIKMVSEENTETIPTNSLSKRAQKKILKREQWLETRPERRAQEKAKKRAKIEKIRQEKG